MMALPMLLLTLVLVVADATTAAGGRRVLVDYNPKSESFGSLRRLEDINIVSRIPDVKFEVFDNDHQRKRRYLQEDDDDDGNDDGDDDDDDDGNNIDDDTIVDEIPTVSFVIDNTNGNNNNVGDVCSIGCEGDYSNIREVLLALAEKEDGAEYELFFSVQGRYAVAAGVIYDNFPKRVQELHDQHPEVDTIILVEVPGSANDHAMVPGAILVHELGYQTCVPSDGHTSSGGTDFFVAGTKRYATPGAQIGIHSWELWDDELEAYVAGSDLPPDHVEHQLYLEFYNAVCIPHQFYWDTLVPGLPMHYITPHEIETRFPFLRDCNNECSSSTTTTIPEVPPPEQQQQTINIVGGKPGGVLTLDPKDVDTFLDAVNTEMEQEQIRGAAYAFKGPGMKEPILGTYGHVSGSPFSPKVTTDTTFMLASISKTFIGAALAVLVDQGKLDLDDDICNVTGSLKVNNGCRNPHFPETIVTWRMMINHRSSMIENVPDPEDNVTASYGPTGVNLGKEVDGNPNYGMEVMGNPSCPIDDIQNFFDTLFLGDESTTTTTVGNLGGYQVNWYEVGEDSGGLWNDTSGPGEVNSYSNFATAYLGALVEKLTGEKFEQFTHNHIFAPAGMNHTAWFSRDLPNNTLQVTPVYAYDNDTNVWEDVGDYCFADYPNGQLRSTIRDMATYADALLNYGVGTFWSKATADANFVGCQEKDETGTILESDSCENSLSWFLLSNTTRDNDWDEEMFLNLDWTNGITHDGGDTGVSTNAIILPESDTYVIVLTNTNDADTDYLTWLVSNLGMDLLEKSGVVEVSAERRRKKAETTTPTKEKDLDNVEEQQTSEGTIMEGGDVGFDLELQFVSGASKSMLASSYLAGVFWVISSLVLTSS